MSDEAAAPISRTTDVDVIAEVVTYADYIRVPGILPAIRG